MKYEYILFYFRDTMKETKWKRKIKFYSRILFYFYKYEKFLGSYLDFLFSIIPFNKCDK